MSWCNLKASARSRAPCVSAASMRSRHCSTGAPVKPASSAASSESARGRRRRSVPSDSTSSPSASSNQRTSGCARNPSFSPGSGNERAASSSARDGGPPRVAGSNVSSMTSPGPKAWPKKRPANSATACRRSSGPAPGRATSVALVPTWTIRGRCSRALSRRTSIATSAPWRPRYMCSSSKTRKNGSRASGRGLTSGRSSGRTSSSSAMT
ncbi:hypothetical protein HRbin26_02183 [bacterium HR26]|nr:hypothetical protein HRbin26_02183 [bacterium HR26]